MNVTVIPPVVEIKTVKVQVAPTKVQLELSEEETRFLIAVLRRVAYSLDNFRLYYELYWKVVKFNPDSVKELNSLNETMDGTIYPRVK